MIRYYKKFFFLKVYENWFEYKYTLKNTLSLNVYWNIKKQDKKRIPAIKQITHTVELDLYQETEAIFAGFSKQIRQQYKIAENEGITAAFNDNNVAEFVVFFNDFASRKNTDLVSNRRIEEIGKSLQISFAYYNGQILAAHSYLIDEQIGIVRHHHSATKRLDENYDKNLIGRANKYLTVKNIEYFKQQGFKTFDFGGYAADTKDESLAGINKYKLLFGGKVVPSTNYFTYSYWLFKKVSRLAGLAGQV
jgi:hypothetical protein